jgi:hypothetical protein
MMHSLSINALLCICGLRARFLTPVKQFDLSLGKSDFGEKPTGLRGVARARLQKLTWFAARTPGRFQTVT